MRDLMHKKTPNGTNEAGFIEQENPFGGSVRSPRLRCGSAAIICGLLRIVVRRVGRPGLVAAGKGERGGKSMHQAIPSTLPNCARAALLCKLAEAFEERILRFRKFAGRGGEGSSTARVLVAIQLELSPACQGYL